MKVGAENKKQLMMMVILLAVAILLLLYNFRDQIFGSASAANVQLAPIAPSSASGKGPTGRLNPDTGLRLDILESSRRVKYEAGGRNIFRMELPQVPKTPIVRDKGPYTVEVPPPPPTPTPPPPIPIIYYGYASPPGAPKRIFLQKQGEDTVFVAALNDIVARRYKVVEIQPTTVTMEDVLTNNRQPIRLTQK